MSDRVPSRYRFDESLLMGSVKDVTKRVPDFKRDVVEDLAKVLNGKSSILSFDFAENLPTLLAMTANLKNEGLENAVKFIQAGLYLLTSKCKRLAKAPNPHLEKYLFETSSLKVENSLCSNAKAETVIVVNPATKKRWAVKKLKNSFESEGQGHVLKQVMLYSRLSHPAIVPFAGFTFYFNHKGQVAPAFVHKRMKNESLHTQWTKDPRVTVPMTFNNTQKMIFMIGMAAGLRYLHRQRIVHRNLRPSNVLLNGKFEPMLCDFGDLPCPNSDFVVYQAPEILTEQMYSEKSDVYSFGMIAYQVVTNMPPWDIEIGSSEIVEMVTAGKRPAFKGAVSPVATKMIKGCWGPNPEERLSIDDVISQLLDMTFLPDTDIARIEEYVKRVLPHHRLKNVDSASSARSVSVSTQKSISATELEGSTPADLETLIENANTGSAKAQVEYGRMLQSGARLEKNEKEAARYYEMAARQGDARGECSLGICYYHGVGVAQSYKLAVKYLKRSSDKGNKEAQYYMGMCMKDGTGVEKNTKSAIKYFKAAAMQGEVASLRHLKELGVSV